MGLNYLDLEGSVSSDVTIDKFYPKSGEPEEIVVVSFKTMNEEVAEDLADFIEKSPINIVDVDVSPNPDIDGKYVVFIEYNRNNNFIPYFSRTIEDLKNVVGRKHKWLFSLMDSDKVFRSDDDKWKKFIELDQAEYLMKYPTEDEESESEEESENVQEHLLADFLSGSLVEKFEYKNDILLLKDYHGNSSKYKLLDFGKRKDVLSEHYKKKPVIIENFYEKTELLSYLGSGWSDDIIDNNHLVQKYGDDRMLVLGDL